MGIFKESEGSERKTQLEAVSQEIFCENQMDVINGELIPIVKMFLCQRYTGEKLKDIGTYLGIGESGVFQACRRVKDKIRKNKKLERKISKIEKKINASRMKTDQLHEKRG